MPRALFEKTGMAAYISHLDLMRLFQRAFKRAGLPLTHTQGYNPRPSVSIALPLSLGVESVCELLDFDLETDGVSCEEIRDRLNQCLTEGVRVLDVYDNGAKIKHRNRKYRTLSNKKEQKRPLDGILLLRTWRLRLDLIENRIPPKRQDNEVCRGDRWPKLPA